MAATTLWIVLVAAMLLLTMYFYGSSGGTRKNGPREPPVDGTGTEVKQSYLPDEHPPK